MIWSRSNIHTLALIAVNVLWSIIIGLFLPRTPTFGLVTLTVIIPGLILLLLRALYQGNGVAPLSARDSNDVPSWIYYSSTTGITIAYILRQTLPESFLEFVILTVSLGWPWVAICLGAANAYNRCLNRRHSLAASLATSAVGLSIGLLIYSIRDTQVMSLFFYLLAGSVLCGTVIGLTGEKKSNDSKKMI